jgi:hypothetical protein
MIGGKGEMTIRMKARSLTAVLVVLAIVVGFVLAWVDSRPNWDDTGLTAGAVFLAAAFFAALSPRRPWLWALAVGAWIPLFGIIGSRNTGSLLALAIALGGAFTGAFVRKSLARPAV